MAVARYGQVAFAQQFLRYVGGDWHDNYLILVVIAWIMAGNKGWQNIRGNNPFLTQATNADKAYRSGTFKMNGITYSRYASFTAAINGTVATLKAGLPSPFSINVMAATLDALRNGHGINGARMVASALARSPWGNPTRYQNSKGQNQILVVLSRFTGLELQPPTKPPPKRPPPQKQPRRVVPPQLRYPLPAVSHPWPSPTEPQAFLKARQWVPPLWTGGKRLA